MMSTLNAKFDGIDTRFDSLSGQIKHLDRDIQLLMRREFGDDRL